MIVAQFNNRDLMESREHSYSVSPVVRENTREERGSMERSVATVIVTYNRLACLRKALAAVMAQSVPIREVIVVDNNSTDETPKFLEEQARYRNPYPLRVVTMNRNEGGAGGFARGMEEAYQRGAELIWLMDDDCIAQPDALERLIKGFTALAERLMADSANQTKPVEPGFVCSHVKWKNDEICTMNVPPPTGDWSRYYRPESPYIGVEHCSFVSVLVNARVIPLVGYPVREFFVWFDDAEFTMRVAKYWPGFAILDSVVIHETSHNRGVHFGDVNSENVWKYRHGARNQTAVLASGRLGTLKAAEFIARQVVRMWARKVPLSLQARVVLSALSGFAFRYKSKIRFPPPSGRET